MIDLPTLLLSFGVDLKKSGNGYIARCIAHEDTHPSMSIYINGTGKHVAHCHACGFHEDSIGCYKHLTGNDDHKAALEALELGTYETGKPWATITNPTEIKKAERTMLLPTADTPLPRMDWLQTQDGAKFGDPEQVWTFRQPDGTPLMYEARWTVEGRKECRIFTYGHRGAAPAKWECSHHPEPRPIYGLDVIAANDGQIAIFEGCRKAEIAQPLVPEGLACTAWSGGAQSWKKADWSPIAGRTCLLFPDADTPGREAMDGLAQHLIDLGCVVHIVDQRDRNGGWDIADEEWTQDSFIEWARANKSPPVEKKTSEETSDVLISEPYIEEPPEYYSPPVEAYHSEQSQDQPEPPIEAYSDDTAWPEPLDIFDDFKPPIVRADMLPESFADWCFDTAGIVGVDPTILAMPAIVAAASMLHDAIQLQPEINNPSWRESARLWGAIVGEPSSKKSPAMAKALSIVKKIDAECNEREGKLKYEYSLLEKVHASNEKAYIDKRAKGDKSAEIPVKPEMPEIPRAIAQDFTIEALRDILKHTGRGILAERDELSGWFGSMDAYKQGKGGSDRAAWLETYNGGSRRIERVGAGSIFVKNWSACIIGGIQPEPMRAIAGNMHEDGLLQRFMVVYGRAGQQGNEKVPDKSADQRYRAVMRQLWDTQPAPETVKLTPEANAIRKEIVAYAYKLIGMGFVSTAMTSHLGKWEGLSARLLLTYHAIDCADKHLHPQSVEVSADTAQRVKALMIDLLLPHATSFYTDVLSGSEQNKHFEAVSNLILANFRGEFSLRDIQRGWIGWHRASEWIHAAIINRLIDAGWIMQAPGGRTSVKSHIPTRYLVNPMLHDFYRYRAERERARRIETTETIKSIRTK